MRLKTAIAVRARFTRFKLEHNENLLDGKPLHDTRKLFEDLWINDLPYERLIEVNGKPLDGAELTAEQARYDKAVAERKPLDLKARAALTGGHLLNVGLALDAPLSDAYRLINSTPEFCEGAPCTHFTFDPTGKSFEGKAVQQRRMEFWVANSAEPMLLSVRYELLKDEQEQKRGSYGRLDWMLFDGVPVERHTLFVGERRVGLFHKFTVRTDNTYDRYRRFATSVTIHSADESGAVP